MLARESFSSAPARSPAGHALPFEETERWLAPLLERVPITRVYEETALDYLGLPSWAAVTPLAKDLTVHAGKGESPQAARLSAIMEAIERVCAEDVDPARVRTASYAQLADEEPGAVCDPALFDLPFETVYEPGRACDWVRGYDLLAERNAWVALDLAVSPAREGVCSGVETNGLASGNTYTEAALHALLELIERDALAHEQFARLYAEPDEAPAIRLIDPATVPGAAAQAIATLTTNGISTLLLQDLTHDLGVPVFRATITDRSFPGREGTAMRFEGLGADLDPAVALARAVHEAAQSHAGFLVGGRDEFEDGQRQHRGTATWIVRQLLRDSQIVSFPQRPHAPPQRPPDPPQDLRDRLDILLDRLRTAGFQHCVVVDLARRDLNVPVVRVLVPGLSGPYGETRRRPARRLLATLIT